MATATPSPRPTASLPPAAASALRRLELAFSSDPVIAEQHRIERVVAGLRVGESTVINGVACTAVSLAVADLLDSYRAAALRAAQLAALAESGLMSDLDARSLVDAEDLMAAVQAKLAAAGQLHLVVS